MLGKGVRALHVAINHYNLDVFRVLLRAGANPDSPNGKGLTPLMLTCILEDEGRGGERATMARELLEAGADPTLADFQGKTALGFAAARSQTDLIDILLQKAPATLNRATPDGLTPLYAAAMSGKDRAVSHLLAAGARQPPASAEKDMCPLVAAVRENHRKVVEVLLSEEGMVAIGGAEAIPRAMGAAAAARKGRAGIVRMLLSAQGERRQRRWARCRFKDDPVLHCAVSFGNMSAARVLLAAGADETAENNEGRLARDVIGFNAPSLQRDPGKKGAIVRMLERGPAFRARSFCWPPPPPPRPLSNADGSAAAAAGDDASAGACDACGGTGGDVCVAGDAGGAAGDACAASEAGGTCVADTRAACGDCANGGAGDASGEDGEDGHPSAAVAPPATAAAATAAAATIADPAGDGGETCGASEHGDEGHPSAAAAGSATAAGAAAAAIADAAVNAVDTAGDGDGDGVDGECCGCGAGDACGAGVDDSTSGSDDDCSSWDDSDSDDFSGDSDSDSDDDGGEEDHDCSPPPPSGPPKPLPRFRIDRPKDKTFLVSAFSR